MILPVRRGGRDRQQKKYPFARRKKNISQRRGVAKEERNPFAALLLCAFA